MAIIEDHLNWSEAIKHNMVKFIGNVRNSLYRIEKLNSVTSF